MLNITKVFIAIATVGTVLFFSREQDIENETVEATVDNTVNQNDNSIIEKSNKADIQSESSVDQENVRKVMSEMGKRSAEKRRLEKQMN